MASAIERLRDTQSTPWHAFWPDSVSLIQGDRVDLNYIHGSRQLTDVFLLVLATENNGRFVTFDRRLSLKAVRRATSDNLIQL